MESTTLSSPSPLTMRAAVRDRYGGPEVLSVSEVPRPVLGDLDVLVRVRASTVTSGDWLLLNGRPHLVRLAFGLVSPKHRIVGMDMAGEVEAVGAAVKRFRPGDKVYGELPSGACAEYVCAREALLAHMPTTVDFGAAAALPVAGSTALQALRDAGRVQPGQHVLIIGAAGGVGCLAVQMAKALGAEVTGVCSPTNAAWVRDLGADHIVDYTHDDFAQGDVRYDVILDFVGDRSIADCRRALAPTGVFVSGASKMGDWLANLPRVASVLWAGATGRQTFTPFMNRPSAEVLAAIAALVDAGKVRPIVHRRYALDEVPTAYRDQGAGHARGRRVVMV